jgi:hypothetical protein
MRGRLCAYRDSYSRRFSYPLAAITPSNASAIAARGGSLPVNI